MKIDQLIGHRLSKIVGRGHGEDFGKRLAPFMGDEWHKQTYYDATNGRRRFRVSEIVALAQAAGVTAYELLDAKDIVEANGKPVTTVTVEKGAEPIPADDLLDMFKAPERPPDLEVSNARSALVHANAALEFAANQLAQAERVLAQLQTPGYRRPVVKS